jgi:hypothetical protein
MPVTPFLINNYPISIIIYAKNPIPINANEISETIVVAALIFVNVHSIGLSGLTIIGTNVPTFLLLTFV